MALLICTSTAFRWRPTALHGEAADVVRVLGDAEATLALLANGYECVFSTCWPPASRLVLDLFTDAWRNTSGPPRERLLGAFTIARERFAEQAPSLLTPDADFPDEVPSAVLLAAVIDGTTVHIAWIGGDVALVARGTEPVVETTPHTLVEQLRREHPGVDLSAVPNIITRTIGPKTLDVGQPDYLAAELAAGDTIVLLSRAPFHGPCVPVKDVAVAAALAQAPSVLAEQLADADFMNSNAAYTAVAVLRLSS